MGVYEGEVKVINTRCRHIYSVIHLTYYIRVGLNQAGVSEVREGSAWRRPVARKIMLEQRHISVTALT
jgi:hypothetical protein